MYNVPTDGCNLEIMGYPFYAEEVSPNEPFRRREYNFNSLVGGTQRITKGQYVGLDFSITTHIRVDPDRPNVHNKIFEEMMSKPVQVVSPETGGTFNALVTIKPEHETPGYLKVTISIKEVPDPGKSRIPGETFTVPKARKVEVKKTNKKDKSDKKDKNDKKDKSSKKSKSKKKTQKKKSKSKSNK